MAFLKLALLASSLFWVGCGAYENPYDPLNGDQDYDGDGLKNAEDPEPKIASNTVKVPVGSTGASKNLSKDWVYYNGSETYDVAVNLAPEGYFLPSLEEVKDGIAKQELLPVTLRVWTTTKLANSSFYEGITPSNSDVLSVNGSSNKLAAIFRRK